MRSFILLAALAAVACLTASSEAFASADLIAGAGALPAIAPFASLAAAAAAGRIPRAILGRIRADADPKTMLAQLASAFETFKSDHVGQLQSALDEVALLRAAVRSGPGAGRGSDVLPPDPEYTRNFKAWARQGRNEAEIVAANATGERSMIRAAMSVGDNANGGYLAPVEWDRQIRKAQTAVSPLRNLCTVITTTTAGYSTVWNNNQWGSGWVGETASRPQTTTPGLASLVFRPGELYAQPAVTQQLLEDAAFDLEAWLSGEVGDEFAKQEAIAFVGGNGTNKPLGFLSYFGTTTTLHPGGEPGVTMSGSATALTGDSLISLVYDLAAGYRPGASWLMSSTTASAMRKLKDGQGNYLWQPSYIVGQPPTLLGYPVAIDENMPAVAAGNYPIAFGDWRRFYVINDRLGTSLLRDPYTAKPFVLFYVRKRVGGGILDPNAVRFLKIGT